jgi:hypothetical protein
MDLSFAIVKGCHQVVEEIISTRKVERTLMYDVRRIVYVVRPYLIQSCSYQQPSLIATIQLYHTLASSIIMMRGLARKAPRPAGR